VSRISLGVQSFVEAEVAAAGRAQRTATLAGALDAIRAAGFPTLNVDLIYGLPGQTVASWLGSLEMALRWAPEELYLYPLYVRPLTGLQRRAERRAAGAVRTGGGGDTGDAGGSGDGGDLRPALYAAGRARLLGAGYAQVSMRMFRAPGAPDGGGPVFDCQEDGTLGLGCGARSYTRAVHYSSEYAVGARGVRAILADYVARPEAAFDVVGHGVRLDREEQTRRFVIQSLLQAAGLSRPAYRTRFGRDVLDDLPQLTALEGHGLATRTAARLRLTAAGLARSDVIGPWLYSAAVRRRSAAYELV
jgi:oxygen-independent coproporphyrinogen-3 oxidase